MAQEFENQLKRMFAELDEDLPAAEFAPRVMSELLRPRQRERLLWSAAILAALAFLWFGYADLESGLRMVAGFPRILFAVTSETLVALSRSSLVYIYGIALAGYGLLWLMRRLGIRVM
jgi:hypothetical protein